MGVETAIALGLTALGSAYGARQQGQQARRAGQRQDRFANEARGFLSGGDMSEVEQQLLAFITGGNPSSSQDGMMQMFRRDGGTQMQGDVVDILQGLVANTPQFDTSELFGALGEVDQRNQARALSDLRGTSASIGQRFGTATRGAEAQLLEGISAQTGARNAQIARDAFESAMQRQLQGAQTLGGLQLGGFQSLLGAQQNRGALDAQILAMMGGQPFIPQGAPYGQAGQDIGSLIMLLPFLRQLQASQGG